MDNTIQLQTLPFKEFPIESTYCICATYTQPTKKFEWQVLYFNANTQKFYFDETCAPTRNIFEEFGVKVLKFGALPSF